MSAILAVVERLYASALAPEYLPEALERMCDLVGGDHAWLVASPARPNFPFAVHARVDPADFARGYQAAANVDAGWARMEAMPIGRAHTRTALVDDREFAASAYYNEVVRPVNGFYSLHVRQEGLAGTMLVGICSASRRGDFDAAAVATLQSLVPHLTMAAAVASALNGARIRGDGIARLLDGIGTGAILVDASGKPILMNQAAEHLLAGGDGLALGPIGLCGAAPADTMHLREAISQQSGAAALAVPDGRCLHLRRPSGRSPLLVTVLPAWAVGASIADAEVDGAAIFIREGDRRLAIDRAAIAAAFGLTRREADVAALLADGISLAEIARMLGIRVPSVRQYAKHAFDKTGARSQAALVASIRGFIDPRG